MCLQIPTDQGKSGKEGKNCGGHDGTPASRALGVHRYRLAPTVYTDITQRVGTKDGDLRQQELLHRIVRLQDVGLRAVRWDTEADGSLRRADTAVVHPDRRLTGVVLAKVTEAVPTPGPVLQELL